METDRDLYQILQVDPAAEPEVVQAAFKRLALKYHPDTNPSPDAHARMQELNEAYAVISDPAQRAAYDMLRQEKLGARRQAEEQAHYQAAAERREEAARQRKEQAAAQRRAENERQAKARAAAAQRRVEYEEQIRAQQAAQRRAKRERQQREWEAQEAAAAPTAASIEAPVAGPVNEPEALPQVVPEAQVWIEVEQGPIDVPCPSESERRQLALRQSQQALRNEIFKLDYGITDAAEQMKYWNGRRIPWRIDLQTGQNTQFIIGGAVTIFAFLAAGFILALGGGIGWPAACCLIGIGAGWFTWRACVSIVPVRYLVDTWAEARRCRELRRQHLKAELARLEAAMQTDSDGASNEHLPKHASAGFDG